jgi:thiamine kinase-like enzyme
MSKSLANLAIVEKQGFRLPDRYREFGPVVERIRLAMAQRPQPTVPCHNDLLAENIIDDGERLWLIDYEYAGNNDPYFELGNIASESGLSTDQLSDLVRRYRGSHSDALLARARLWALMSQYGWTLWASIQDAVSDLEFDFWGWGMEKYRRAVATFDGAELEKLITQVRLSE